MKTNTTHTEECLRNKKVLIDHSPSGLLRGCTCQCHQQSESCQWENCSGGRYCEKHSFEVVSSVITMTKEELNAIFAEAKSDERSRILKLIEEIKYKPVQEVENYTWGWTSALDILREEINNEK